MFTMILLATFEQCMDESFDCIQRALGNATAGLVYCIQAGRPEAECWAEYDGLLDFYLESCDAALVECLSDPS